ncbi:MAG: hypothetical protein P4M11_03800 [Candidatus Pacebacteria bacterium]|nr:hypothetical protein [Candidatus Paceibacterota bacterium]
MQVIDSTGPSDSIKKAILYLHRTFLKHTFIREDACSPLNAAERKSDAKEPVQHPIAVKVLEFAQHA